jgi:long-chain acyl-CoA synthetase
VDLESTPVGAVAQRSGSYGRVAARLARQVEVALGKADVSMPQYRILMLLDEGPAVASRLAEHLAVTKPTVTAVVDGLVARGLVCRNQDEEGDRRRVDLTLSPAGRHLLERAELSVAARIQEVANHLPDAGKVAQALDGLDLWREALDAHRAEKLRSRT